MDRLWKILTVTVSLAALVAVLFQRVTISRLEDRLETVEAERPAPKAAHGEARTAYLEQRLASLEQTLARVFRMSLNNGKDRAPTGVQAPTPTAGTEAVTPDRMSRLREDVDALLTGEALSTEQGRKQLHSVIRKAQEEVWQERRQRWSAMRSELQQERMKTFAKEAGLNTNQQERLTTLMQDERSRRGALMRSARDGQVPFSQAVASVQNLRKAIDQQVKGLLDSKQYEQYEKMRSERHHWR